MADSTFSTKHVAIDKANAQMAVAVGVASFFVVFGIIGAKGLLSQHSYTAKVVKAKNKANQQLIANIKAFDQLADEYDKFDSASKNIIEGSRSGTGDNDGTNSKIVLDALPSKYDFPALASSLEKVLSDQKLSTSTISGIDDELNQQANLVSPSPVSVPIPFSIEIKDANYVTTQTFITTLERSIRPIQLLTLSIRGSASSLSMSISAETYYQSGKSVNITSKVVK